MTRRQGWSDGSERLRGGGADNVRNIRANIAQGVAVQGMASRVLGTHMVLGRTRTPVPATWTRSPAATSGAMRSAQRSYKKTRISFPSESAHWNCAAEQVQRGMAAQLGLCGTALPHLMQEQAQQALSTAPPRRCRGGAVKLLQRPDALDCCLQGGSAVPVPGRKTRRQVCSSPSHACRASLRRRPVPSRKCVCLEKARARHRIQAQRCAAHPLAGIYRVVRARLQQRMP